MVDTMFARVEFLFPDFSKYRAIISSNGAVRWEPAGVFETSCKIDITFYPYDSQICALEFGTWAYTSKQVLRYITVHGTDVLLVTSSSSCSTQALFVLTLCSTGHTERKCQYHLMHMTSLRYR